MSSYKFTKAQRTPVLNILTEYGNILHSKQKLTTFERKQAIFCLCVKIIQIFAQKILHFNQFLIIFFSFHELTFP